MVNIFHITNKRNKVVRNNILLSGLFKAIGLLTSLLIVPITIGYLDNEIYGIWMTISSILFWVGAFDMGLGNGMRNFLTEAISKNNHELARKYVTTSFVYLFIIAAVLFLVCIVPLNFLNYNKIFNTQQLPNNTLREAFIIAISFTLCNFVLKNVGYIFIALQKYAINDFLTVSGNVIALIIIYILTKTTKGNLLYVVLAYTGIPVLIFFLATIPIFAKYTWLRPRKEAIDNQIGITVVKKGLGFFVIQITSILVIFGAANLFITQYCGPTQVTVYNIAYKFFNLLVIAYTIVISPMWNAYTDAYVKGDFKWIKSNFIRSLKLWGLSVCGGIIMLLLANIFFKLWVGDKVTVPFTVSLCTLVYVCAFNLNNCATYLINGLNKIRVQIITSIVFTALYIILVIIFGHTHTIEGIVLNMAFCYMCMAIVHLYQCRLLINGKATGIWEK